MGSKAILGLIFLSLMLFIFVSGCTQEAFACNKPYIQVGSECCLDQDSNEICDKDEQGQQPAAQGANADENAMGATGDEAGSANATADENAIGAGEAGAKDAGVGGGGAFEEWKAPDGSITLQVPAGWKPSEKQVDTCTVSWAVLDPAGTSSAYMDNEIMVLKSEDARQMYKTYGMSGIDNAPVSSYLGAEQAVQQIIAPLTGASNVRIIYTDDAMSQQFSQAVCIAGFAACDARVFEAAYQRNGILMRGKYFVQTYDFGEGTTWWINIWGYTSPAEGWDNSIPVLERTFTSVKYTDEWAAKCQKNSDEASAVIGEVVKSRQASSEKSAEEWDKYIRGG
ncbi:MAG: hypothetical protein ABIH83_02010 [Candidatus Micrarchaeota archaeon]